MDAASASAMWGLVTSFLGGAGHRDLASAAAGPSLKHARVSTVSTARCSTTPVTMNSAVVSSTLSLIGRGTSASSVTQVKCSICSRQYRSLAFLQQHMQDSHKAKASATALHRWVLDHQVSMMLETYIGICPKLYLRHCEAHTMWPVYDVCRPPPLVKPVQLVHNSSHPAAARQSNSRMLLCGQCARSFGTHEALASHRVDVHGRA
jgi:hypothetical protein